MTTASFDRPMKAVFTPDDAAETAQALADQKARWAGFLTARDALLGVWHGTTSRLSSLTERLHLSGALTMARRGLGWLLGGLERTSEGLRTPGVRPALLWALTTRRGGQVAARVTRPVLSAARTGQGWTFRMSLGMLRRLGSPGRTVAGWLEAKTAATGTWITVRVRPAVEIASMVLSPSGLLLQAVNAWARARTIGSVLRRLLPGRWRLLGQLLPAYLAVPSSVRAQLLTLLPGSTSPRDEDREPEDDPTPPAAVVDLGAARDKATDEDGPVHPSAQRYPAKRSANAKRRR